MWRERTFKEANNKERKMDMKKLWMWVYIEGISESLERSVIPRTEALQTCQVMMVLTRRIHVAD